MSLQKLQKDALIHMLNFNQDMQEELPADTDDDGVFLGRWKVLIYDEFCKNMLTPLLNNYELRKYGVTLHLSIDQPRDKIPGLPIIYFVQPTENNIRNIVKDLSLHLYDAVYLNFSSPISNELMSLLGQLSVDAQITENIIEVHDQFFSCIALENELYSLQLPSIYSIISNPRTTSKLIEDTIAEDVPSSLFTLIVSIGCIPAIRASPNGAAALVAEKLANRIRQEINQPINLFSSSSTSLPVLRNPLLILIDRDIDLVQPLHHTANYQSLLHDVCSTHYNRVNVQPTKGPIQSFYLDKNTDTFWRDYSGRMFPEAADGNKTSINHIMEEVDKVKFKTNSAQNQSSDLKQVVDTIPELMNQKKQLEKHTTILKDIMDKLNERDLPTYYEYEHSLIQGQAVDIKQLCKLITEKGSIEDKIRLMIIACVLGDKESIPEYDKALRTYMLTLSPEQQSAIEAGVEKAYKYIKAYNSGKAMNATNKQGGYDLLKKANTIFKLGRSAVKGLMGEEEKCTIINIIEELISGKHSSLTENYIYFDPKTNKQYELKPTYNDVIICVIGGGCYSEYLNIQNYMKTQNSGRIFFYGSTDILSPSDFLNELKSSYEP